MSRPPFPSTGSLGLVPRLHRYSERLRLPAAHPASLRCLRSAVPSVHPTRFALGSGGRPAAKPGVCSPGSPFRLLSLGHDRISLGSLEALGCVSCSSTPAGGAPLDHSSEATLWPSTCTTCRLPRVEYFEVQSHGPRPRCVRFAAGVTPEPRNTRYRLAWPRLAGRDFHPLGFIAEFPGFTGPSVSPFPTARACLAHGADPLSSFVDSKGWERFWVVLKKPYLAA